MEKLRIVEEGLTGRRQASAMARRHDIPNSLLFKWRKAYREGRLVVGATPAFVPARIIVAEDEAVGSPSKPLPRGGRIEIVLAADRRVIVGADVDALALGRVLDALDRVLDALERR